jgi:hypothetical protein
MVNRKSRNAYYVEHGSPRKKLTEEVQKEKILSKHPKERKTGRNKRKHLTQEIFKKTILKFSNLISTIPGKEHEILNELNQCIESEFKIQILKDDYSIISDKHQIILSNYKKERIMVSKMYLKKILMTFTKYDT